MLPGSNDVLGVLPRTSRSTALNAVLRWILLIVCPWSSGCVTWRICRDLRDRDERPIQRPLAVARSGGTPSGGYDAEHDGPRDERDEP